MSNKIADEGLDTLFLSARTQNGWQDKPVPAELLRELYQLVRMGPTSANCSPARFVFITTEAGRARLAPALSKGNVEKTMTAPVNVIVAWDTKFYDALPVLFPHGDARSWFTSSESFARETALRNSSMQAAYLIMAARALGLDTGPMSGFDAKIVDAAFFADTSWTVNQIINLGYGDAKKVYDRLYRFDFEEACIYV